MPGFYIGRPHDSDAVQSAWTPKTGPCRRGLTIEKALENVRRRSLAALLQAEARKARIDVSPQEPFRAAVHHQQTWRHAVQQLDHIDVPERMQHPHPVPAPELLGLFHVVRDRRMCQ